MRFTLPLDAFIPKRRYEDSESNQYKWHSCTTTYLFCHLIGGTLNCLSDFLYKYPERLIIRKSSYSVTTYQKSEELHSTVVCYECRKQPRFL